MKEIFAVSGMVLICIKGFLGNVLMLAASAADNIKIEVAIGAIPEPNSNDQGLLALEVDFKLSSTEGAIKDLNWVLMYASFQNNFDTTAFETVSCLMQYT